MQENIKTVKIPAKRKFGARLWARICSRTGLILVVLAVVLLLVGFGCVHINKIPAQGKLQGYALKTTVDHESAKFYLENYLAGKARNAEFTQKINQVHQQLQTDLPSRAQLKKLSQAFSVDFAALLFGNQLLKQKGNAELQTQFQKNLLKVQTGDVVYLPKDVLIMMAPGYGYIENGQETGADFASPRKLLQAVGYPVDFVEIDQFGSVEANAEFVSKRILSQKDRKIVLVGASSANPAIHLALGKLLTSSDTKHVLAWLNLGGILQGVPVLDKFSSGPQSWLFSALMWFKGWQRSSFESMSTAASRQRFADLSVPKHISVYNYLGLSLSGDISHFAWDKYLMMREDGPNDGLTLLPDILAPNSLSILSFQTDHFFAEDPQIDNKTLALLVTVIERLGV